MTDVVRQHVVLTPGVCGGRPRVAGTRIRVADVAEWHERQGWSVDEILGQFPQLTRGDVYAALAYYWDHRQEIDADEAEGQRLADELRRESAGPLQEKLKHRGRG